MAEKEGRRSSDSHGRLPATLWGITILLLVLLGSVNGAAASDEITCGKCHADKVLLRSLSPRWRDVFVDSAQFATDPHGTLDCIACHESDAYAAFPHKALPPSRRDPADPARVKDTCGTCHQEITARFLNSLHNTLEGHKTALVDLLGEKDGATRFQSCTSCHASCTDCHMKQPDRYGRLVPQTERHHFTRSPAAAVCKACHGQTAETYLGARNNADHGPSAMAAAGLECVDCHSEADVHGNGRRPTFIGETAEPKCLTCHGGSAMTVTTAKGMLTPRLFDAKNPSHQMHQQRVACVACHTQWYTNCWDCHKGSAKQDSSKFFLALNPESGEVHTAIHVPINAELGGVKPEVGGWAIKTAHSWGKPQSCQKCHTDPSVYISPDARQAKFVSFWGPKHANGLFVDEKLVKQITITPQSLEQSAHKGIACEACHSSLADDVCTGCHRENRNRSQLPYWQTDDLLQTSNRRLSQLRAIGAGSAEWERRWTSLRDQYLQAGNDFHGNPELSETHIRAIHRDAVQLNRKVNAELGKSKHEAKK